LSEIRRAIHELVSQGQRQNTFCIQVENKNMRILRRMQEHPVQQLGRMKYIKHEDRKADVGKRKAS
jgi:hypothetical protein